jgi:branched-chain amino acid transport system substrate-binding protein
MWLIAVALAIAAAVVLSACGGGGSSSGSSETTAESEAEPSAAGSEPSGSETASDTSGESGEYAKETVAIGLKDTGGKEGEADSSLEPLKVGITYQLGGVPAFPEMEASAKATVQFINSTLGGADGHPIELVPCNIQAEEDGQKCGAELLEAKVPIGMQTLAVIGNQSLYQTVGCKFPILVGSPSTGPDTTSKCVYTLGGSGSAVLYAMAKDTSELAKGGEAALISVGNQGGRFTMKEIAEPALDGLNVKHSDTVYYPDSATTPEIVSALQASNATEAAVIFLDPSTPQQCSSIYQAMQQLGLSGKPVVTTGICNAPSFVDEDAGGEPEGWRIWGFGPNPRVTGDKEGQAYVNIMEVAGEEESINIGFSSLSARDLLAITDMANELGAKNWTPEQFEEQILAYKGPPFLISGEMNCGQSPDPNQPGICGDTATGAAFENGEWVTIGPITWPGA